MIGEKQKFETEEKIYGDDVIEIIYFHSRTCGHCHAQNRFMEESIFPVYPNVKLVEYEISRPGWNQVYKEVASKIEGLDPNLFGGTPTTVIGDKYNVGFGTPETTGIKIIEMIEAEQKRIDSNWNDETMTRTIDIK